MKLRHIHAGAIALAVLAAPAFAQAPQQTGGGGPNPNHPGKPAFEKACAACHTAAPADARTPTFASLAEMPSAQLRDAMAEGGKMAPMAAALTPEERVQVVAYLGSGQAPARGPGGGASNADWTQSIMCAADKRGVDVTKATNGQGFGGPDLKGGRMYTAKQAGLKKSDMKNLEVAWVIGLPGGGGVGNGAAVIGDTAFITAGGRLSALDPQAGCIKWTVAGVNSRNTPAVGEIGGKKVLAFSVGGDIAVYEAATGAKVWQGAWAPAQPTTGRYSIRGGVVIFKDKVIVPLSASGVGGNGPNGECCVGHGAVVALAAADGKRLWEYHTMPEATYNGKVNSQGKKQQGPSGAPIWSVPIIDEKRNRIIVTTGENTSHPSTDTSDAVIALDLDTGKEVWKFQAMIHDVWNMQCRNTKEDSGANCPWTIEGDTGVGRDFDFGAGAILARSGNRDIVLAGQKSGDMWAFDADTGVKLWNTRVSQGTALGGVHWGITYDGTRVFAPINDPVLTGQVKLRPGMFALNMKTGKEVWAYDAKADCDGPRGQLVSNCATKFGFSAAPVVVDGAVIGGTLDGKVFVFDSSNGKVLKSFDFIGEKTTINGIPGKGGSLDAHGISVANGTILVGAGYGSFNQTPGNVLIGLKPKKK